MKPHVFFRNPIEGVERFRQPTRNPGIQDEEEEKNYDPMKEDFIRCQDSFNIDRETRIRKRNSLLNVPAHIEFVEIHFFDSFNSGKFENLYRTRFGLAPVCFKEFNSVGIFAVLNIDLLSHFLEQFELFINTDNHFENPPYDKLIKFIKEFYFLTTERIIEFPEQKGYVVLNLIKNPEFYQTYTTPIENSLIRYLEHRSISYTIDAENESIEMVNVQNDVLFEILDNFDIFHSVNSYSAGIVRPSPFNMPVREYGFSITNSEEDLPVIGIIDTGISNNTPLGILIINQGNEFDATNTSPLLDEANHGTAVAALAALGNRLIPNHIGEFESDAKLLSIKTLNGTSGIVKISDVEQLIRNAYRRYHCKIFTLTILFEQPLKDNENISEYAYMLDKLANELDILVFISAGNNYELIEGSLTSKPVDYPHHFAEEKRNICSPADSLNNIVVGAIADNFENNSQVVLPPDSSFPASYTRKFNVGAHKVLKNSRRKSKHLVKPDIAFPGGDFDNIISCEFSGIKVISTASGIYFDRLAGTSLSAPLAANLAAKLIRIYPALLNNMQSVKALIINSASEPNLGGNFNSIHIDARKLFGKGVCDISNCLYSDENAITLLLEDLIHPDQIISYPLHIPEYLLNLPHKKGVIEITTTLCYKIKPMPDLHISYCPICISFGFFNNRHLNNVTSSSIKLKTDLSWSEDYYYGTKLLSNCHKSKFRLDKSVISRENNIIKFAINCKSHKLLNQSQKNSLNQEWPFSVAITIKEIPLKDKLTGRLYAELEAVNTLESIATLEAILEINT